MSKTGTEFPLWRDADGMAWRKKWLWAERNTSNRRKPGESDRDVPSCLVTCPYPAKNIAILVPRPCVA